MLIIPADLPLLAPEDLDNIFSMAPPNPSIVISPSYDGGTNALLCTPPDVILPQFGFNSFRKHISRASSNGISCSIYHSDRVSCDIDLPKDLNRLSIENLEEVRKGRHGAVPLSEGFSSGAGFGRLRSALIKKKY